MSGGGGGGNTTVTNNQPWVGVQPYFTTSSRNFVGLYPKAADLFNEDLTPWAGRTVAPEDSTQAFGRQGLIDYAYGQAYNEDINAARLTAHGLSLAMDPSGNPLVRELQGGIQGAGEHLRSLMHEHPEYGHIRTEFNPSDIIYGLPQRPDYGVPAYNPGLNTPNFVGFGSAGPPVPGGGGPVPTPMPPDVLGRFRGNAPPGSIGASRLGGVLGRSAPAVLSSSTPIKTRGGETIPLNLNPTNMTAIRQLPAPTAQAAPTTAALPPSNVGPVPQLIIPTRGRGPRPTSGIPDFGGFDPFVEPRINLPQGNYNLPTARLPTSQVTQQATVPLPGAGSFQQPFPRNIPWAKQIRPPNVNIPSAGDFGGIQYRTPGVGRGNYNLAPIGPDTAYLEQLDRLMEASRGGPSTFNRAIWRLSSGDVNTAPFEAATQAAQARTMENLNAARQTATEGFQRDVLPGIQSQFQQAGTKGSTRHQLAVARATDRFLDEQAGLERSAQRELADIATNAFVPAFQQAQELAARAAELDQRGFITSEDRAAQAAGIAQAAHQARQNLGLGAYQARLTDQAQRDLESAKINLDTQQLRGQTGVQLQQLAEQARQTDVDAALQSANRNLAYRQLGEQARTTDVNARLDLARQGIDYRQLEEQGRQADIEAALTVAQQGINREQLGEQARATDIDALLNRRQQNLGLAQLAEQGRQTDIDALLQQRQQQMGLIDVARQARADDINLGIARATNVLNAQTLGEEARQADMDAILRNQAERTRMMDLAERARQTDISSMLQGTGQQIDWQRLLADTGLSYQQLADQTQLGQMDRFQRFQELQDQARRADNVRLTEMARLAEQSRQAQRQEGLTAADLALGGLNEMSRTGVTSAAAAMQAFPQVAQMSMMPARIAEEVGALRRNEAQIDLENEIRMHRELQDMPWELVNRYAAILQANPAYSRSIVEETGGGGSRALNTLGGALGGAGAGSAAANALLAANSPWAPWLVGGGALLGGLGGLFG